MKRLAVIILLLSGCSAVVPSQTPNAPVKVDALLYEQVNLWTADTPSLHAAATGANVTWNIGTPPADQFGAYTTWWCVFDACTFSVVVRPGYWVRDVIRHEAGHVWCRTWLNDASERCADQAAGLPVDPPTTAAPSEVQP